MRKGGRCREREPYYSVMFHPACVGPLGLALGELLVSPEAPVAAEVAAAARAITEAGISLHLTGVPTYRGGFLHEAIYRGHAKAVSVLITAGFNPREEWDDYYPLHWIALFGAGGEYDGDAGLNVTPDMPEVLRHFIGGLHAAGLADSFDGWNDGDLHGAPLDDLNENLRPDDPAAGEVHALMYERGGRCSDSEGGKFCEVPVENVLARSAADFAGPVLTCLRGISGGRFFQCFCRTPRRGRSWRREGGLCMRTLRRVRSGLLFHESGRRGRRRSRRRGRRGRRSRGRRFSQLR